MNRIVVIALSDHGVNANTRFFAVDQFRQPFDPLQTSINGRAKKVT
jgi:hypothetical protein